MFGDIGRMCSNVAMRMGRVKKLDSNVMQTELSRCLTTADITLLGIGHMFGAGIYVLTGTVARDTAGPAIILSFLLAGFASLLSAICYAEFGARVPKAGSAYVYTYVTIGEFWAFVIGWNIVLEYLIGGASVARAWSSYVDSLFNGAVQNGTIATFGTMHSQYLAPYVDPLAFGITLVFCLFLTIGVKSSTNINSALTCVNMAVAIFVIVFGLWFADIKNWQGPGGFAPYGVTGVVAGAATCFFAYAGFDGIATAGEEAKNPSRSIPIATMLSMGIVTCAYILVGATLTLMVPYREIHVGSALPDAFAVNNIMWAKYVVSIGALCGMTTSLLGNLFSLPRCVYAMASDGLIFSQFAVVSEKTKLPMLNVVVCGLLTAFTALIFDLEKLVEFMSIGILMAYTIVSASVIILRYQPEHSSKTDVDAAVDVPPTPATPAAPADIEPGRAEGEGSMGGRLKPKCYWVALVLGQREPGVVVSYAVVAFTAVSAGLCLLMQYGMGSVTANTLLHNQTLQEAVLRYPMLYERLMKSRGQATPDWAIVLAVFFCVLLLTCAGVIMAHTQSALRLSFKVPFVPLLPLTSIFVNISFIVHLNPMTWVRFIVWMTIGLLLYFCYGIHHSRQTAPLSSYTTLLPQDPGSSASPSSASPAEAGPSAAKPSSDASDITMKSSKVDPASKKSFANTLASTLSQVSKKVSSLSSSIQSKKNYSDLDTTADDAVMLTAEESPAVKDDNV
ncbi:hypothetical protein HAZT_HAZT003712 [Hyalella azteca]|uniref:Cationic amino acid transporter C-terminal domain-containing protein n=1 Tax=Hyalella azteca TaxID=294128 RepID=A0A6A0H2V7_HYAAZ|nr:hypothetical protein HAZT_HAZT003712 [Hyalella azteca]